LRARVYMYEYLSTVVLELLTQWIPTVDHCVLVKVGLLTPTVG
jgi:hypothetical protein